MCDCSDCCNCAFKVGFRCPVCLLFECLISWEKLRCICLLFYISSGNGTEINRLQKITRYLLRNLNIKSYQSSFYLYKIQEKFPGELKKKREKKVCDEEQEAKEKD